MKLKSLVVAGLFMMMAAGPAAASQCGNSGAGFDRWLGSFKKEAAAAGIGSRALGALKGLTYSRQVVRLDRNQKSFKISQAAFIKGRVTPVRVRRAKQKLKKHARLFNSIEKKYGVPKEIVVAIWAMETDFGVNRGKMNVFRSLATLAYDCRRSAFFKNELMSALKIAHRGWMSPGQMRGAWAGELGQTQFLASSYLNYAVDYNGDGRRDLVRSTADVLASTANYLKRKGWRRGGGFNQGALREWNKSSKYQKAIAVFAQRVSK
jgi:lytic murein transglycosylase